ncbi:hypothetical protein QWY93_11315 [Echinicola jeungdonensis]|uniref:Lipocalin-like domain-containing protein n=1 Tax=Echinicola jeungdonensis TaxID=709343 RepID=A0ABV5J8M9_9BACT|nr:hypothetical protein [Echinicola jeungdonensis]MDN3669914.1 hypothetical protein [Echinicola jeungdonensis]
MKAMNLFQTIIFSFFLFLFSSCGGGEESEPEPKKTQEEIATEKLTGESSSTTWVVTGDGSVTHKGSNVTSEYADFSLTLSAISSNRTYTTTNGGYLFDESGSWSFSGDGYGKIMLTGGSPAAGKEMSFSGAAGTLILEFNVPAPEEARVNALAGDYRFELKKE